MHELKVNEERLKNDFNNITAISATEEGCTRFSFSDEDRKVRDYLKTQFFNLGLSVKTDFVGNIRASYNPENLSTPPVLFGSHIDTVKMGGRYDGLAGVLTGLEAIRVIKESSIKLNNPIELVVFSEEEGSNFRYPLFGSKFLTGKANIEDIKTIFNSEGVSAYEIVKNSFFAPEDTKIGFNKGDVKAFIELHIEQGGILDLKEAKIGVVEAIAGFAPLKITVTGEPNHAGSTPMYLRKNPMLAAAEIMNRIGDLPEKLNLTTAVLTIGRVVVVPNSFNVIPATVEFNVDLRDGNMESLLKLKEEIKKVIKETQDIVNTEISYEELSPADPVLMSNSIVSAIEESAEELGVSYIKINSGALHDTGMLDGLTDLGMIFIPSIGGISHSPKENTDFKDIVTGTEVLIKTILKLVT